VAWPHDEVALCEVLGRGLVYGIPQALAHRIEMRVRKRPLIQFPIQRVKYRPNRVAKRVPILKVRLRLTDQLLQGLALSGNICRQILNRF
jgi:hypothetical protein